MGAITSYADLVDFGQPVIETREAAARLATSTSNASHLLRAAERAGLVRRLRAGLWAIDPSVAPFAVAPYLTAPFPAYVSTWSALARHEMIEQIPASVFVVSLDRSRTVRTSVGQFSIHHITQSCSRASRVIRPADTWPQPRRPCSTSSTPARRAAVSSTCRS